MALWILHGVWPYKLWAPRWRWRAPSARRMDAMSATLSRFRAVQEATAHNNAAIDLLHVGRTAEAAAGFRAAVSVQPDGPEAYYNLGIAYKDQGRHRDSVAAYGAALALRPSFPEASFNAGRALQMLTDDPGPLGLLRPGLYATQGSNPGLADPSQGLCCHSRVRASPWTGTRRAGRRCSTPRPTSRRRRRRALHRSAARAPTRTAHWRRCSTSWATLPPPLPLSSPLTTHHSPLTTHHSPLTTHHSPLTLTLIRWPHATRT